MDTSLHLPCLRLYSRRNKIANPDMGPLAGVVFTLVSFFMATSYFAPREPIVQLPEDYYDGNCMMEPSSTFTITINKDNRIFFAIGNEYYQTGIIAAVAAKYSVRFTAQQPQELQKLPYIGMDVRRLPEYLAAPRMQQYSILKSGVPVDQLAEYIDATRGAYSAHERKPVFCHIRADKQIRFAKFKRITNVLQQRNINRFSLDTYGLVRPARIL